MRIHSKLGHVPLAMSKAGLKNRQGILMHLCATPGGTQLPSRGYGPGRGGDDILGAVSLPHRQAEGSSHINNLVFTALPNNAAHVVVPTGYHVSLLWAGIDMSCRDILIIACLIRSSVWECLCRKK